MTYPATETRNAAQNTVAISDAITRPIARRPFQVTRADNWVGGGEDRFEACATSTCEIKFDAVAGMMVCSATKVNATFIPSFRQKCQMKSKSLGTERGLP
jgi:hypothetical protein